MVNVIDYISSLFRLQFSLLTQEISKSFWAPMSDPGLAMENTTSPGFTRAFVQTLPFSCSFLVVQKANWAFLILDNVFVLTLFQIAIYLLGKRSPSRSDSERETGRAETRIIEMNNRKEFMRYSSSQLYVSKYQDQETKLISKKAYSRPGNVMEVPSL